MICDVPILRSGRPYHEQGNASSFATTPAAEPVARLSLANPGLISRDLLPDAWTPLQDLRVERDPAPCSARRRAHFMTGVAAGGRTASIARANSSRAQSRHDRPAATRSAGRTWRRSSRPCCNMAAILDGLTGGLDLDVLDAGYGLPRRPRGELCPQGPAVRRRVAGQFARRARLVAAGHRPEDAAGPEAGPARAVDAAANPRIAPRGRVSRVGPSGSIPRGTTGPASSCGSAARR